MRSLAQPNVLGRAALAAFFTTLVCAPALATSPKSVLPLWFSAPVLFFCVFLLWAFVFGWHFEYTGRPVFQPPFKPKLWAGATLYGVGAGLFAHFLLDPSLRRVVPDEYPANAASWLATTFFQLGFGPLYLCFAPFAFFMRLTRRPTAATGLTVIWVVFVEYLALGSHPILPPVTVTAVIMLRSVVAGFVAIYMYLNGGALLVWWVAFLIQSRLLLDLGVIH